MKIKPFRNSVLSLAVLLIVFIVGQYAFNDDAIQPTVKIVDSQSNDTDFQTKSDVPILQPQQSVASLLQATEENNPDPMDNPFFEAETKARLIQVADDFAEDIQYPDYSKPIRHQSELQKYLPNQSIASSLPLNSKDENSPRISVKTSKLHYFQGEPIVGEAVVDGLKGNERVDVSVRLVNAGQVLSESHAQPLDNAGKVFYLEFIPENIPSVNGDGNIRLVAQFTIDQKVYEIGTPVQYINSVASIDYVSDAQVNDTFLEIPVYITTYQPGYHQVSANLYNADTGEALLHLSADKELLVEKDFILLRAHIAALKVTKHEGPYELKDLSLTRMPSPPQFSTEYGRVPDDSISLSGFPFDDYRDEPYLDEEAQERLEFLTKLGGKT